MYCLYIAISDMHIAKIDIFIDIDKMLQYIIDNFECKEYLYVHEAIMSYKVNHTSTFNQN